MDISSEALAGDAAIMREFKQSQAYDVFSRYLDAMMSDTLARLATGSKEQFEGVKGILDGLKLAKMVPDHVIRLAKEAR